MFKKNKFAVLLAAGALALSACTVTDQKDETATQTQETEQATVVETRNIVTLAVENPNLSTLVAAVTAGDLVGALSDEKAELTVFAPTNTAFAAIQGTVDELLLPANQAALQDVLLYHVVSGKVLASELRDGQTIPTLGGEELQVSIKQGKVYINNALVQTADVVASNGVVHVIDAVLVPGQNTIVDLAVETADLSTLVAAVTAGDLAGALADRSANLTVFAPVNSAFAAIQSTVDTLLLPENQADLRSVLLYHVVDTKVLSSELQDGQVIMTLNGKTLMVDITDGVVRIGGAKVVTADIEAANGVVHLIDTVLVP